jgi:hypothetical protein
LRNILGTHVHTFFQPGIVKLYFVELPKEVQERFDYGPATPRADASEGAA